MANLNSQVVTFAGQDVTVWSGDPAKGPGPLLIYWYATGSSPSEVLTGVGQAQITKILAEGGVIAAQNKTTAAGATTGNSVWYTGDAPIADEVVACAVKNQNIDVRRISSLGYSAGALQTTYMWFARSGYVASVISYSGGDLVINRAPFQDSTHAGAAIAAHGAPGVDTYDGADFAAGSATWETEIATAGAFAIDCDDGQAHVYIPRLTNLAPVSLAFFQAHPFGVKPEPWTTLPSGFPTYCTIK